MRIFKRLTDEEREERFRDVERRFTEEDAAKAMRWETVPRWYVILCAILVLFGMVLLLVDAISLGALFWK